MFQLTKIEYQTLRFQTGTLEKGRHSKYLPYAFTEQGVAMLSSVLHSERAVFVNVDIMRAFVSLRRSLSTNKDLVQAVKDLRHKVGRHDTEIGLIIKTIEKMIAFEEKPKPRIGFIT